MRQDLALSRVSLGNDRKRGWCRDRPSLVRARPNGSARPIGRAREPSERDGQRSEEPVLAAVRVLPTAVADVVVARAEFNRPFAREEPVTRSKSRCRVQLEPRVVGRLGRVLDAQPAFQIQPSAFAVARDAIQRQEAVAFGSVGVVLEESGRRGGEEVRLVLHLSAEGAEARARLVPEDRKRDAEALARVFGPKEASVDAPKQRDLTLLLREGDRRRRRQQSKGEKSGEKGQVRYPEGSPKARV